MAKSRFTSVVPGQAVTDKPRFNLNLLLINVASVTLSFLVSITVSNFVVSSVQEVQKVTRHKLPDPVANLFAAVIVTAVVVGVLALLFAWEQRELQNEYREDNEE